MTEHPPHILGVKVRRRPILMPAPSSNTQDGHFDGEQDDDLEAECVWPLGSKCPRRALSVLSFSRHRMVRLGPSFKQMGCAMSDNQEPWLSAIKNDPRSEEQIRAD